jgi:hypothetical protein
MKTKWWEELIWWGLGLAMAPAFVRIASELSTALK